ncbi:MAG: methylmalonyl-CoA mutase family protein, partial [Bacteroidota bacterium]
MENTNHLFSEFSPVSKSDWLAQVEKDLRGKPLSDLQAHLGNLEIDPFPHPDDFKLPGQNHQPPTPLFQNAVWEICEDVEAKDVLAADRQALRALEGGAQALRFVVNENLGDHRMESLLEGIDLAAVSIHFLEKNKNAQPLHLLTHFHHVAKARHGKAVGNITSGSVNWLHEGAVVVPDAVELVEMAQDKLPNFKVLTINVREDFSNPNGMVQALANAVAQAERWISELTDHGISAEAVNRCLQFSVPVGVNYFVEIAKLRALRLLWANVLNGWNVEKAEMPPIES